MTSRMVPPTDDRSSDTPWSHPRESTASRTAGARTETWDKILAEVIVRDDAVGEWVIGGCLRTRRREREGSNQCRSCLPRALAHRLAFLVLLAATSHAERALRAEGGILATEPARGPEPPDPARQRLGRARHALLAHVDPEGIPAAAGRPPAYRRVWTVRPPRMHPGFSTPVIWRFCRRLPTCARACTDTVRA